MNAETSADAPRWIAPATGAAGAVEPSKLSGRFVVTAPSAEHVRGLLSTMRAMREQGVSWESVRYTSPEMAPFRLLDRPGLASFRSTPVGRALRTATTRHRWTSLGGDVELPETAEVPLASHEVHIEREKVYWIADVTGEGWRLKCRAFRRADLLGQRLFTAPGAALGATLRRLAACDPERAARTLEAGRLSPEFGDGGPRRVLTRHLDPEDLTALLTHTSPPLRRACLHLLGEIGPADGAHPR